MTTLVISSVLITYCNPITGAAPYQSLRPDTGRPVPAKKAILFWAESGCDIEKENAIRMYNCKDWFLLVCFFMNPKLFTPHVSYGLM